MPREKEGASSMIRKIQEDALDSRYRIWWALHYAAVRLEETGEANMKDAILLLTQMAEEIYE